jgi:hypothetical protein
MTQSIRTLRVMVAGVAGAAALDRALVPALAAAVLVNALCLWNYL